MADICQFFAHAGLAPIVAADRDEYVEALGCHDK